MVAYSSAKENATTGTVGFVKLHEIHARDPGLLKAILTFCITFKFKKKTPVVETFGSQTTCTDYPINGL